MPSSSASHAKRKHLTLQQKVLIIEKREREGLKQDELSRWAAAEFRLPKVPTQPTISNILKHKDKLLEALRRNPRSRVKSVRDVKCPAFVEAIVSWIHAQDCQVTRRSILEFAMAKKSAFPDASELQLSEGWLSRILARYGIHLNGGEGSVYSEEQEEDGEEDDDEEEEEMEEVDSEVEVEEAPADQVMEEHEGTTREERAPLPSKRKVEKVAKTKDESQRPRHGKLPAPMRSLVRAALPAQANSRAEPDNDAEEIYGHVREYYSNTLKVSLDLKTNANTFSSHESSHAIIREIAKLLPEEAQARNFGCGVPIPLGIEGLKVIDLGCGSGRDACVLSALVGVHGKVVGVDMLPQLVDDASYCSRLFTERLSYERGSLDFVEGYIERLDEIPGIFCGSVDLAIANFSISLCPDKERALRQVYRALRAGGEFQFSDIYATRRLPDTVRIDEALHNEGLGGAFYIDDFTALSREIGFGQPRQVSVAPITIKDEQLAAQVGNTQFYSITFRCFKVPDMELRETEEDYGHVAKYLGTIPGLPFAYQLDATHRFETRRPIRIGGNTAAILKHSWLAKYFHVDGDWSEHFGRFNASSIEPLDQAGHRLRP